MRGENEGGCVSQTIHNRKERGVTRVGASVVEDLEGADKEDVTNPVPSRGQKSEGSGGKTGWLQW